MDELGLDPKTGYSSIVSVILDGVILKKGQDDMISLVATIVIVRQDLAGL